MGDRSAATGDDLLTTYSNALAGFRRAAVLCIALSALAGISEALGLAALIPLLSATAGSDAARQEEFFGLRGDSLAAVALLLLMTLGAGSAALRYASDLRLLVLSQRLEESLRGRMMTALLQTSYGAFLHQSLGDSVKLVVTQGNQVSVGAHALLTGLGNAVVVLVFVVVAGFVSLPMTLGTLAFGAAMTSIYRKMGRRAEGLSSDLSMQAADVTDTVTELLANHKYYRSTGHVTAALDRAAMIFAAWRDRVIQTQRVAPLVRVTNEVGGVLFLGAVLALSMFVGQGGSVRGLVFLALFYRLAPRVQSVQQSWLLARTQTAWWTAWQDRYVRALQDAEPHPVGRPVSDTPVVAARNVSYTYDVSAAPALEGVSWELRRGRCLAIVGESGSGKTTMLDIVTGLLSPTSGQLLLDEVPLEEYDVAAWQRRIGLVMQSTPTFAGSVLSNIAWSDPTPDVDRAWVAAEAAMIAPLIRQLPQQMATVLGQGGGRLSGGQRQRLALARALYGDPALLILDEATSALDAESELAVQESLSAIKGRCSILLVAHRLATVRLADHILVMAGGRVIEEGGWAALAARGGAFRRMLEQQDVSTVFTTPQPG